MRGEDGSNRSLRNEIMMYVKITQEEEEEVAQRAKGGGKGVKGEEDSEADDEADSESEPSDVDWYREEVCPPPPLSIHTHTTPLP